MKRYEKYKPSGVEWLGEVPEHWEVKPLKFLTTKIVDGSHFTPTYIDTGVPFLRVTDIQNNDINMENIKYIPQEEHLELVKRCNPEKGDLLLSKNGTIGVTKVIDWNWEFSIFVSLCLIKFNTKINSTFAHYVFESHSLQEQIFGLTKKNTVTNLHLDKIREFWFIVPTLNEQLGIINFLDKKTEKIDRLISRQQALLEKLSEKRTALITETVCGRVRLPTALNDNETLSSNVPLRNSGIEWLGEVPEHWEIKPLKFAVSYNDETLPENTDLDEEILYVDISSVSLTDGIKNKELMIFENAPSRARRIVKDGDVLVSTVRTYLKAIAQVESAEPNLIASTGFAVLRSKCGLNSQYLGYYIQSEGIVGAIVANSVGVSYPAINASDLVRLPICIPSETEQTIIANYLDKKTEKINHLQNKIERVIERLKEYRSALITQVVTGKVKV
ncbi:restriction endonuclease subunit S [Mannheimia bovis]|uniref:Restriction endonuclease subunit S n=1 Tax=Mannheimia bovis TaxID=2770636 RepID=A0A7H1C4K0_9PAST|nr:restriction endonuclease subunit S [Mannheimia bovis]QNS15905.1 restriction endonuclease subunit S [Mannheimia bovis]